MSKKTIRQAQANQESGPNWSLYLGVGFVVVVLAIIAAIFLFPPSPPVNGGFTNEELAANGHAKGPVDAPVVLVEFSDYECPACGAAFRPVENLLARYPNQIRFVYRHFPLIGTHPNAVPAAEAAECAEDQGKFWELHDALFLNQSTWVPSGREGIRSQASQIGLDMDSFDRCIASRTHLSTIQSDLDDGIRFGVYSTPTFFVNGKRFDGFSQSQLEAAVEAELRK